MEETEQVEAEMPNSQVSEAQLVAALFGQCRQWLRAGVSGDEVHAALLRAGLHEDDALAMVQDITAGVAKERFERGRRNILYGGLWLAGSGSALAAVMQAGLPAGNLVLTALVGLFGAVLLIRGIVQIKSVGGERNPAVPTE